MSNIAYCHDRCNTFVLRISVYSVTKVLYVLSEICA